MPHYREKQNLKSSPKCEESVTALLFFFHRKLRPMKQKSAPQGCALGAKVDGC